MVDHCHSLAGCVVEHHVVDLGVVVRDALRDRAGCHEVEDSTGLVAVRVHERHLRGDVLEAALHVGLRGGVELLKAVARVVEAGYDVMQARTWQIGEVVLEARERLGHLVRLVRTLDEVVCARALDEHVLPPGLRVVEHRQGAARIVRVL